MLLNMLGPMAMTLNYSYAFFPSAALNECVRYQEILGSVLKRPGSCQQ